MYRRHLLQSLATLALGAGFGLLTASPATAAPAPVDIKLQRPLHVGRSLRYDKGLKVTFVRISFDHRCPINARCLVAGDAKIILRIKAGNQPAKEYPLHTNKKPRRLVIPANALQPDFAGIPKSYIIDIGSLTPRPYAGKPIRQKDFKLRLHIETAH